jgi:hypothetical protein
MAEKDNQFQGVVESLLKGMDTVLSTKTVVGEATKIGDTIILPLVDVTFGVGAGAGNNSEKRSASGAGGLGGKMTPSDLFNQLQCLLISRCNTKNQKFFFFVMRLYELPGIKNI